MTLEVLFAQQGQAETFLRMVLLGAVLWETGIRRILRWIGKRLKKSFPSGRNMQNHSE